MMPSELIPRIIAWILIVAGVGLAGYNGYHWWDESNLATEDPRLAKQIAKDWDNQTEEESLTSVDDMETNNDTPQTDVTEQPGEDTTGRQNDQQRDDQPKKQPPSPNKQKPIHRPDKLGSKIGNLYIPQIGASLPIIEGTTDASLKKGVGKYIGYGTVAPDQTGHVVLSGHRDTVFRKLNAGNGKSKIEKGHKIAVKYRGKVYTYQVRKTWITKSTDRTIIIPYDRPILTVTTCYPFDFVGSAPDRFIIQADLVDVAIAK